MNTAALSSWMTATSLPHGGRPAFQLAGFPKLVLDSHFLKAHSQKPFNKEAQNYPSVIRISLNIDRFFKSVPNIFLQRNSHKTGHPSKPVILLIQVLDDLEKFHALYLDF
jgi:hypothetical protein